MNLSILENLGQSRPISGHLTNLGCGYLIFIGGRTANTLPRQIWGGIRTSLDPVIPAFSVLLITEVFLAFAIVLTRQLAVARARRRKAV